MKKSKIILIALSLIFLSLTLYVGYGKYDNIKHAIKTTATIKGFEERVDEKREKRGNGSRTRTKKTTFYYPIFQFTDNQGNNVEKKSNVAKGNSPEYSIGEKVEILYTPGKSNDAHINSFFSLWIGTLLLGIVTFILLITTFAVGNKRA